MLFAITVDSSGTKIVQVGKDAPRYAQCVYCGMPVVLTNCDGYAYHHTNILAISECQKLRDRDQEELERVLNVKRT